MPNVFCIASSDWLLLIVLLATVAGLDPMCWTNGRSFRKCCLGKEDCWSQRGYFEGFGEFSRERCCSDSDGESYINFQDLDAWTRARRRVAAAFGKHSLGFLVVRRVPGLALALDELFRRRREVPWNLRKHSGCSALDPWPFVPLTFATPRFRSFRWASRSKAGYRTLASNVTNGLSVGSEKDLELYAACQQLGRLVASAVLSKVLPAIDELARLGGTGLSDWLQRLQTAHVAMHHYPWQPEHDLKAFEQIYAGTARIPEGAKDAHLLFDQRKWTSLHMWHQDTFFASVQFAPRIVGNLSQFEHLRDGTFFLSHQGHMIRLRSLQKSDLAIWVGKAVEEASGGNVHAAVHTVLLQRDIMHGVIAQGSERQSVLLHMWPSSVYAEHLRNAEATIFHDDEPAIRYCHRPEGWPWKYNVRVDVDLQGSFRS